MTINEENYVDKAERVIKALSEKTEERRGKIYKKGMLTTSQIRNQLAMCSDIYNEIMTGEAGTGNQLSEEICGRINYLKVRFVYEAGRDSKVKDFVESAEILKILESIKGNKKNFLMFSRYMEALVAFHRYYGGKDSK